MTASAWTRVVIAALSILAAAATYAADVAIPVRLYMNKPGSKTKLVAKGAFPLPDPNDDNPVLEGAALVLTAGAATETLVLSAGGWGTLGNPAGSRGFRYADPTGNTCKKLMVKSKVIKGICRPTTPAAPPYHAGTDPALSMVLSIGIGTQRYCAECPNGGVQLGNPELVTKMKDCAAPAVCPAAPPPTPTPTATATPTATPTVDGYCCDYASGCSSAPTFVACLKIAGGSTVGGGAVCDASGNCVAPPGTPGECCEGVVVVPVCTMNVDQATCEGDGGTYHASAVCQPDATCLDMP